MSNQPHTINLGQIHVLLEGLGIKPDLHNLKSIHMEGGRVEVVHYRRNGDGKRYLVGPNESATETVTIAIESRA